MCVSIEIELALYLEINLPFLLEGRFNGGFFALPVWGAYTWRGFFSGFYEYITEHFTYIYEYFDGESIIHNHWWFVKFPPR